ncbi:MAG: DNA integrity scanning protein DisA nucleotide-binding domain protein [Planctomycetia bacterium]|nr:DNA integrity scanning protein DisA nucleotide-binding domain protein [Planctomycetia bacterium]
MRILYVEIPALAERFAGVRHALRTQAQALPRIALTPIQLGQFLAATAEQAADLIVAECAIAEFVDQFEQNRDAAVSILRREPDAWAKMDGASAAAALWYAALGEAPLVYVHDAEAVPSRVLELHLDNKRVSFVTRDEASAPAFLERALYRFDANVLPVRVLQRHTLRREGGQYVSGAVSPFLSEVMAECFEHDGITRAVFAECQAHYGAVSPVARTLCLLTRYARRMVTEHLEGAPVQLQCAIVPDAWWGDHRAEFRLLLEFQDNPPRLSLRELGILKKSAHCSDGASSLFIVSPDGVLRALVDVGAAHGGDAHSPATLAARQRVDVLTRRFPGFVVSTDCHGRVWVHSSQLQSPIVHLHETWNFDVTAGPVKALRDALENRGSERATIDRLVALIHTLSDERIGGFLLLHADPASLAVPLHATPLRGELQPHFRLPIDLNAVAPPVAVKLFSLDGCHSIDLQGRVRLLCQQLNPPSPGDDAHESGTKHTTARNAALAVREAIVVVISHDGPVTVFADGTKTTSTGRTGY